MNLCNDVNLISLGSQEQTSAVHTTLIELGAAVIPINFESLIKEGFSNTSNPSLLILGNNSLQQKEWMEYFPVAFKENLVALYSHPISDVEKTFLSSCKECCFWPCESLELSFRLERLSYVKKNCIEDNLSSESSSSDWVKLNLVGTTPIFKNMLNIVKNCANCEAPVVIEGETGSGKEMVARAIHYLSDRCDNPFIPVNCGAIPDHLVENEFFGHEKGAFTDAKQSHAGVITQADGGTLFLDEIETLSEKGQVVLLRFLEDQHIRPLGAKQSKKVNVRVVAASNISLSKLVSEHRFRLDLLYRLNLLSIQLPPLRERSSDTENLAQYFMEKFRKQYQQPDKVLSLDTIEWMKQYEWPGNVRELENFLHRQFLLNDESMIRQISTAENYCPSNSQRKLFDRRQNFEFDSPFQEAKTEVINHFEKKYLSWLMSKCQGNVSMAARISDKERRALGKLLKKHSIYPDQYRGHPDS